MPLTMARPGKESFIIKKISGKDETRRHLANLGFVEGASVTVVSEVAGNLVIGIKGTRIAIDKAMANRIII